MRKQVEGCDLIELYDMVCDKSGYTAALREKNDMESRGRLENVEERNPAFRVIWKTSKVSRRCPAFWTKWRCIRIWTASPTATTA